MTTITKKKKTKQTMADVGPQSFTKSFFLYPTSYCKIIRELPLSIVLMPIIVGHPEPEKKSSVGIFEYILASMLKVYLDVF